METNQEILKKALIKKYGTMIEQDYDKLIDKFNAVVTGHCFAGDQGDNPLCILNRALNKILEK